MPEVRFATAADVRMRLHDTFLRYKNNHYYALHPGPEDRTINLILNDIVTKKPVITIDANDPELDVTSPPLGYVQYPKWNDCVFISRIPFRRQKQGVSHDSVSVYSVWDMRERMHSRDYFHTEFFLSNLSGVFPTYGGVLASINKSKETKIARAFDRSFCILHNKEKETLLQYNCTNIGVIDTTTKLVTLYPEHNHSVFTMKLAELGASVAE